MHKDDIKVSENMNIDYIPEDHNLCLRCYFFEICPLEYVCESLKRCQDHEDLVNDNPDERVDEA